MRTWARATVLGLGLGQVAAARADGTVVASTDQESAVLDALSPMLEAPVRLGRAPEVLDLEPLFHWVEAEGATYGVVVDRATRRVYVAIPGERRLLERVLAAHADPYVVAVSATELWELARFGEPAEARITPTTDPPPDLGPQEDEVGAPDEPMVPSGRLPVTVHLVGALSAGLGDRLTWADPGAGVSFPLGEGGRISLELGLLVGGRVVRTVTTAGGPVELRYRRSALEARVGPGFGIGRLVLRPVATLRLDWVHVAAEALDAPGSGVDDRVAGRVGLALDALLPVGRRLVLGASLGAEAYLGRAPYVALGTRVLTEPPLGISARVVVGLTFPDEPDPH